MKDYRLLYDSFNIYYNKGFKAFKENNLNVAKRNFLLAAETLLKLAKDSNEAIKIKRVKRAEELVELAQRIDTKQINLPNLDASSIDNSSSKVVLDENVSVTLEEAINELNSLEGLHRVKEQVSDLIYQIKTFGLRSAVGLPNPVMSHHMIFTGNPGTGKTTVARIIGKIFKALGILSKGHLKEVDRSDLVAGYVGQTDSKTKEVLQEAMGGVLFIDEAYSLSQPGNDFGVQAIDLLNKTMEDSRSDLVVIAAGYKDEMDKFLDANRGLRSRFSTVIEFEDYSPEELYNIFKNILKKHKYTIDSDAEKIVYRYLFNGNFEGNARDVRNLFEDIIKLQSRRIANLKNPNYSEIATIYKEDLPFKVRDSLKPTKEFVEPVVEDIDQTSFPPINNDSKEETVYTSIEKAPITTKDDFDVKDLLKKKRKHEDVVTEVLPEDEYLNQPVVSSEYKFDWDSLPIIDFDDIAGLESVKDVVRTKVLLPLEHPEAFEGYVKKNGGGLFLYGPPGTGKTMIAAAIANEIGAKFCSVKPSDLLHQGAGNTEKAVKALFQQARQYPCSVIYFDEMDSIAQKNTKSSYSKQLRSELLSQLQGIESYGKDTGNLLFLIAATNKPWDVDSAFVRPGRFGTKVYVGLPDEDARRYMITSRLDKIRQKGIVTICDDIDINEFVERTNGFNGSDITNVLDRIDEFSAIRSVRTNQKYICKYDVDRAFEEVKSSVQPDDIERLIAWKDQNNG